MSKQNNENHEPLYDIVRFWSVAVALFYLYSYFFSHFEFISVLHIFLATTVCFTGAFVKHSAFRRLFHISASCSYVGLLECTLYKTSKLSILTVLSSANWLPTLALSTAIVFSTHIEKNWDKGWYDFFYGLIIFQVYFLAMEHWVCTSPAHHSTLMCTIFPGPSDDPYVYFYNPFYLFLVHVVFSLMGLGLAFTAEWTDPSPAPSPASGKQPSSPGLNSTGAEKDIPIGVRSVEMLRQRKKGASCNEGKSTSCQEDMDDESMVNIASLGIATFL